MYVHSNFIIFACNIYTNLEKRKIGKYWFLEGDQ